MKRILYLLLIPLVLVSCKDDFDISKLQDSPRLVVYSFPTEGDTTLIAVTKSVPIVVAKGDRYALSNLPVDAHIIYKVNGTEFPVKRIESEEEARHFCYYTGEHTFELMKGQYYAVGHQQAGDHISVEVSAEGFEPVSASTDIPEKMKVQIDDIKVRDWNDSSSVSMNQMEVSLADEGSSKDYYSVKVNKIQMAGEAICMNKHSDMGKDYVDTIRVYTYRDYRDKAEEYPNGIWNFDSLFLMKEEQTIDTDKEPILNKQTKLDEDLGFDGYEFFYNSYVFDDRLFNGKKYTLHLGLVNSKSFNTYFSNFWDPLYGFTYIVELYKLTPEYYRYLSAVNSAKSNSWAEAGIMQVTPTYSNVKGGFGVVAGFSVNTVSQYIAPPNEIKKDAFAY